MKEESRIEALEHELKILKNEIQTTLLEIREQILNHYYPELRAEEPLRSLSLPVRPQVGRPGVPPKSNQRPPEVPNTLSELEAKSQIQPFSDIFLEDLEDEESEEESSLINSRRPTIPGIDDETDDDLGDYMDDDDDIDDDLEIDHSVSAAVADVKMKKIVPGPANPTNVAPKTREVNFRQLKQAAAPKVEMPAPLQVEPDSPKAKQPSFAALATWANEAVTKVGKEQATEIVETYATGGQLSSETKASLMQLIALTRENEPAGPADTQAMLSLMVGLDQLLA